MRIKKYLPAVLFALLFFCVGFGLKALGQTRTQADIARTQDETPPEVKEVALPAGTKLKDANWHCYAGGFCELWLLTKPRPASEKPETYLFQNADGTRKYVIKEQ